METGEDFRRDGLLEVAGIRTAGNGWMESRPVTHAKPYRQASGKYSLKVNKNANFMNLYVHKEEKALSCGTHTSELAAYSALVGRGALAKK